MNATTEATIKVALVDDHVMFRDGLRLLLEADQDIELVGEASDARTSFALVDREHPDVVVLDLKLPGMDGVTATRELKSRSPSTKVLIVSAYAAPHEVQEAIDAGALGYLPKTEDGQTLLRGIHAVAAGQRFLAPTLNAPWTARRLSTDGGPLARLSKRERDVFRLLVAGLNNREIAKELCISHKTVESHREHVLKKLELHSIVELVRYAAANQLLDQ